MRSQSVLRVASKSSCKALIEKFIMRQIKLTVPQMRVLFDRLCTNEDGSRSEYMYDKVLKLGYKALDEGKMPSLPIMLNIFIALNKPFRRKKKVAEEVPEDVEETTEQTELVTEATEQAKPDDENSLTV